MPESNERSEALRLEQLWKGDFGDAYVERNKQAAAVRAPFWRSLLEAHPVSRVLEVGCNLGANLTWIAEKVPATSVYGVDVNASALRQLRASVPDVNAVSSPARELPFRDRFFDLV